MNKLAAILRKIGQENSVGGQDSILAHITPKEAAILKRLGGSGRTDPVTGGVHFEDDGEGDNGFGDSFSGGWDNADPGNGGSAFGGPDNDNSGTVENDAPGRGLGPNEDAPVGLGPAVDNDPFGNPLDDTPGLSGGNGAPGGGLSGSGMGPGEGFGSGDPDTSTWGVSWNLTPEQQQQHDRAVNESIANWMGYDPGRTSLGDVGNYISNYFGWNNSKQNNAEPAFADENSTSFGQGANFNAPGANQWGFTPSQVSKAADEYNHLGWQDALTGNPWGYTGLDNESHTNWGAVGNTAASALNSPVAAGVAAFTGLGPAYGLVNSAVQAARGNYTPGVNTLAGIVGGKEAVAGVNALQNMINGTPGNIAAPMLSQYLDSIAPGAGTLANVAGITSMGARGINDVYQTALNDAISATPTDGLSSESAGGVDSGATAYAANDSSAEPAGVATAAFDAPSFDVAGGGGGPNDVSNYFMGSKKKSRYRAANQLMAMLGEDYAA